MACGQAVQWTPTEACILDTLADGLPHLPDELHSCRGRYGARRNIRFHITNIRRKLAPVGETIVCELYRGKVHYRHIPLLCSSVANPQV